MSLSVVRYIELISVKKQEDVYYFHIIVYIDQAIELQMEVDAYTGSSLLAQCTFEADYKYRLSLRAVEDVFSNRLYSTITKTFLTTSERIEFNTSPLYKQHIEHIKNCISSEQLVQLPFMTRDAFMYEDEEVTQAKTEDHTVEEQPLLQAENDGPVEVAPSMELSEDKPTNDSILEEMTLAPTTDEQPESDALTVQSDDTIAIEEDDPPVAERPSTANTKKRLPKRLVMITLSIFAIAVILVIANLFSSNTNQADQVPAAETASPLKGTLESYTIDEGYTFSLAPEYVALTFTKGPSVYTEDIIAILEQYQVGATFFVIGKHVSQYPEKVELLANKGFSIGHATENYRLLTTLSFEQQQNEWQSTADKIEQLIKRPVTLFRPPYGLFNSDTQYLVEEQYFHIVNWTIDPYDVKAQVADDIVHYIEQQPLKGGIINLTESSATVEALPAIIEMLLQQNVKVVMLK